MDSSIRQVRKLDSLLAKHLNKYVKIVKQDAKLLTAPGENYGSVMMALSLRIIDEKGNEDDLKLVAKTIPINEMLKEIFQVQISFVKELNVYVKVVPALRELEDEYSIRDNRASDLFCKCYGGRKNLPEDEGLVDENAVILLENLKISGYENGDRLQGFDYKTATKVLENLARFHATPIALKILKPEVFTETVDATLKVEPSPNRIDAAKIDVFVDGLLKVLQSSESSDSKDKAEKLAKNIRESLSTSMYQREEPSKPFVTFGHSDFWMNNMMLQKDTMNLNLKIVDFQTPAHQSLACDLLFFMYSSISADTLYGNEDTLLRAYHDSFINCLRTFKLNNLGDYTWDKFITEVEKQSSFVLNQIMFMYKVILMERGQISDMNEFSEDDMFSFDNVSEACKLRMKKTFEAFVKRGWLN